MGKQSAAVQVANAGSNNERFEILKNYLTMDDEAKDATAVATEKRKAADAYYKEHKGVIDSCQPTKKERKPRTTKAKDTPATAITTDETISANDGATLAQTTDVGGANVE